jgi:VWFA-related protein
MAVLIGGLTLVFAQEKPVGPISNEQTGYSESVAYEPRRFVEKSSKRKKEKKSKNNPDEKNKAPENENRATPFDKDSGRLRIPVFAYDAKGKPVNDLKDSDFKLLLDGNEQEILTFETARQPLDLVLVVDMSASTAYQPKDIKNFVAKLAETLQPADKIQIISFSDRFKILCESTNDKEVIKKAVNKLEPGGGTSIYEAVETIFRKFININDTQKSIIILSDGVDTTSLKANYPTSLLTAEKNAVPVFPFYLNTFDNAQKHPGLIPNGLLGFKLSGLVGMTKEEYELGLTYLQDIALLSGGRAFEVKNLPDVKTEELREILESLKPQYLITFKTPETAGQSPRRQLKVRINRPNLKVQARGSLLAQ